MSSTATKLCLKDSLVYLFHKLINTHFLEPEACNLFGRAVSLRTCSCADTFSALLLQLNCNEEMMWKSESGHDNVQIDPGLIPFPPIIDKSSVYPFGAYLAFQLGLKINAFTAAD